MTIAARIDYDCRCLNNYFKKLFEVLKAAQSDEKVAPVEVLDMGATDSLASFHGFSHLIKPDMLINIYSLLDFWFPNVCNYQQNRKNLELSYKDIKGKNDLHSYQKYLTRYIGLDISGLATEYQQLDNLRKVRNRLIHHGGHIPSENQKEFSAINGISVLDLNITIHESFVWNSLESTKTYLRRVSMI